MRSTVNINQDEDIASYSLFLTCYSYASTTCQSLMGVLLGAGVTFGIYKGAAMCGITPLATTVGIGLLAAGFFAKKPVEDFIAYASELGKAFKEEEIRENKLR